MIVSILGAGSFGTALAKVISETAETIYLFGRDDSVIDSINENNVNCNYFPDIKLNNNIVAKHINRDRDLIPSTDIIIFTVPSGSTRTLSRELKDLLEDKTLISTAKGIEYPQLNTMSRIISEETGSHNVFSLSGPTFADELIMGFFAGATVGIPEGNGNLDLIKEVFSSPLLLVDYSEDIESVELCGILKNVYSIATGIFDSFFHSFNEHHTFLNLCFKEMNEILEKVSTDKKLIYKFCAFGDFNLTTNANKSRNRTLGLMVGKEFLKLNEFNPSIIFEGLKSVKALQDKGEQLGVNTPIIRFVNRALNNSSNINLQINDLLNELRNHNIN